MNCNELVQMGLNGKDDLKLILSGYVEEKEEGKIGIVSVVYATEDRDLAEKKFTQLSTSCPNKYFMIYSVPFNTDLDTLVHYPSIVIEKDDLV